jgi:hypothetical protein
MNEQRQETLNLSENEFRRKKFAFLLGDQLRKNIPQAISDFVKVA